MKNLILRTLIILTIGAFGAIFAEAQKTSEVNIYMFKAGAENGRNSSENNPFGLVAVKRAVDARAPLRGALIALTESELTEEERRQNLFAPVWGIKFVSVNIKRSTAYAYFTMPDGAAFSGDLSPDIFRSAVEQTALQFKSVKRVVVCLDGILDFDSESEEPARRCSEK